jgi:hypothetical protein
MGYIDDFTFEVCAGTTNILGQSSEEQVTVAYSPQETDFAEDYKEQFAGVYLIPLS